MTHHFQVKLLSFSCTFLAKLPKQLSGDKDTCCSASNLCALDEGSCSSDSDCQPGLICGTGSCSWESGRSCCRRPCDSSTPEDDRGTCCADAGTCDREHEGGCSSSAECAGDLVCGSENCHWDDSTNCCWHPCFRQGVAADSDDLVDPYVSPSLEDCWMDCYVRFQFAGAY